MILVDTNIFIDYWKHPKESETKIFQENEIAVCGVIQTGFQVPFGQEIIIFN